MSAVSAVHEILFSAHIDPAEEEKLLALGAGDCSDYASIARRIIMYRERALFPTPFSVRFGPSDFRFENIEGFEIAVDLADQAVSIPIVRDGEFEPALTSCFRRNLKPGMHAIDVGGNIGFFSMLAASIVGPSGSVRTFEPFSENCRMILLSRERNGFSHIDLIPTALGDQNGSAFYSTALGTNGGIQPSVADQLINPMCSVIPILRLDDLPRRHVDLIKLDVEGSEWMVVSGAEETILTSRPVICSEFLPSLLASVSGIHPVDYIRKICSLGYRVSRLAPEVAPDAEEDILDVDSFMASYGPVTRISELVFYPV